MNEKTIYKLLLKAHFMKLCINNDKNFKTKFNDEI